MGRRQRHLLGRRPRQDRRRRHRQRRLLPRLMGLRRRPAGLSTPRITHDRQRARRRGLDVYRFHLDSPNSIHEVHEGSHRHGHANARSDNFYSVAYRCQAEPHMPFPPLPEMSDRVPTVQFVERSRKRQGTYQPGSPGAEMSDPMSSEKDRSREPPSTTMISTPRRRERFRCVVNCRARTGRPNARPATSASKSGRSGQTAARQHMTRPVPRRSADTSASLPTLRIRNQEDDVGAISTAAPTRPTEPPPLASRTRPER